MGTLQNYTATRATDALFYCCFCSFCNSSASRRVHSTRSDQCYYTSGCAVVSLEWALTDTSSPSLLYSETMLLLIAVCRLLY